MPLPAVGSPAPDFTLPSTSGATVTLSALRGSKVLIAFFPAAFTRVCTAEMCAFSVDAPRFRELDAVVLPISVDNVPSLKAFRAAEGLSLDLLSDLTREVSRRYGTLNEERCVSSRAYVIVDREGIVRWTWEEETPGQRRDDGELLDRLRAVD